ncbi:hypothetical protein PVAND_008305 [Polypedilum vanderplanki]|uniref:Ataxin-2 C-terminal domain-containing protein n=1 Tax=Polypedilum vanderplanki TaxID=319348 RepID=A0A9J6C981_POLVA|nr:hypothetical protein PVAND_008305 [Polypedilum vanderplanki]
MCIEKLPKGSSADKMSNIDLVDIFDPRLEEEIIETDVESYNSETDYSSTEEPVELFSEYMWMENEVEFDDEELKRLEEEELGIQCMIAMSQLLLLDEIKQVEDEQRKESVLTDIAQKSSLNPFAAEFFPADIRV